MTLTAVRLLAPHLTADNHGDVLTSARGKKRLEILEIVARLSPRPDVPTSARKLPTPTIPLIAPEPPAPSAPASATAVAGPSAWTASAAVAKASSPTPGRPAAVTPLSPDRYKLQLTISGDLLDKLSLAKDMFSHVVPAGDDATVLDRALTALLEELARKKFARTRRSRKSRRPADPSDLSAEVQRIVWVRDRGRCTYVGTDGHRCNERRFVQFHHIVPRALRGEATPDQITLRCRSHNDYEGRLYFGRRRRNGDGTVREGVARYGIDPSPSDPSVAEHVPEHAGSIALVAAIPRVFVPFTP